MAGEKKMHRVFSDSGSPVMTACLIHDNGRWWSDSFTISDLNKAGENIPESVKYVGSSDKVYPDWDMSSYGPGGIYDATLEALEEARRIRKRIQDEARREAHGDMDGSEAC